MWRVSDICFCNLFIFLTIYLYKQCFRTHTTYNVKYIIHLHITYYFVYKFKNHILIYRNILILTTQYPSRSNHFVLTCSFCTGDRYIIDDVFNINIHDHKFRFIHDEFTNNKYDTWMVIWADVLIVKSLENEIMKRVRKCCLVKGHI